jgi:ribA/ribD-fused uncharacterized protein
MKRITEFQGEHRWLSNFWPCDILLDGLTYPTVEHAYQAAKTDDPKLRDAIRFAGTPGNAKRMGNTIILPADWSERKVEVMAYLLRQKFSAANPELRDKLMATGNAELIEGNKWGDQFWGVCRGKGQNNLGKLLMSIRKKLVNGDDA